MLCTFYLFCTVAQDGVFNENDTTEDKAYKYSLTALSIGLCCYQVYIEAQQFISFDWNDYVSSPWNWNNCVHFLTAFYTYFTMLLSDDELLYHRATGPIRSIALFTLWTSFFDWLRLFDRTSFLIKLVQQTLKDIIAFLLLFIIALVMIGSAMYALEFT